MASTDTSAAELRAQAAQFHQEHVFDVLEGHPEREAALLAELGKVDFAQLAASFASAQELLSTTSSGASEAFTPFPADQTHDLARLDPATRGEWRAKGLELTAKGTVAVLLLAGGQGSRLGSSDPKGMYDIGLPSGKSLYQLHAEKLLRVRALAAEAAGVAADAVHVPWYIMTSEATDAPTRAFFQAHAFFGVPEADVLFFQQGQLPAVDLDGRLLVRATQPRVEFQWAPDGNGGVFRALTQRAMLADMEARGVQWVHMTSVDNPLVKVADPLFTGHAAALGTDIANKVVRKRDAAEKVGVLCLRDGSAGVVEYSEISAAMSEQRDAAGDLVFGCANIAIHLFSTAFLKEIARDALPFHAAKKSIAVAGPDGLAVAPETPNGIKLEMFLFDAFPRATRVSALVVDRAQEFSAVKNAPGSERDSPDTARAAVSALAVSQIEQAGGSVAASSDEVLCEISPLVSYEGEGLDALVKGKEFTSPVYLS